MKKVFSILKKELTEMIPSFIFFLIVFHVLEYAKILTQEEYGMKASSAFTATINALIVSKSILLANMLPFVQLFNNKKLIYNTLWKIFLYLLLILFIQYLEEVIPLLNHGDAFSTASKHVISEFSSVKFRVTHIILTLFLFIYVILEELMDLLGKERFYQLFFGKREKVIKE